MSKGGEKVMKSIAHIRVEDDRIQSVEEHLLEVKRLAETFGKKLGVKHMAGLAGMLHDLGKYSNEFSSYILSAVYNPDHAPRRGSVDHSTAGGKLLYDFFHNKEDNIMKKLLAEIVGNVIISHHSYLHDFLSPDITSPFLKRVGEKELPEFAETKEMFFEHVMTKEDFYSYVSKATDELNNFLKKVNPDELKFQVMFLSKYIFSCLIDADRTNTRQFVENEQPTSQKTKDKEVQELFSDYYFKLAKKLDEFKQDKHSQSKINSLRSKMSDQCEKFSKKPSDIYTLSIPTGGGKTLASLRYALKHAQLYNKKRIIYIVPYTTIIEQNAEDVRKIIQDDMNLLEHHSNVIIDKPNDEDIYISDVNRRLLLAEDNWDAPIIFTTMVQFLNVFYAHGSRNIRRLHNLSDSIIIFDEVQKVPTHCVSLFNRSLNFLRKYANSSMILCTATQPALDYVEHQLDIKHQAEIIEDLPEIIDAFKRVEVIDKATTVNFTNAKLTQFIFKQLEAKDSVLVILNTKSVVRDLFKQLEEQNDEEVMLFHLSTSMCAAHRNNILEEVRNYLKHNKKVICISTQLIEAGVDISFDCVIRSLAGLDSIAQAAGRCNRNGEVNIREVYVIDHEEENLKHLKEIKVGKEITKKLLIDLKHNAEAHGGYILSPKAMGRYFQQFYATFENDLNYPVQNLSKNMADLLGGTKKSNSYYNAYQYKWNVNLPLVLTNSYQTAAKHFQVIDNPATSVLVPYESGKDYIALFNSHEEIEDLSEVIKRSQRYTVNVYEHELNELEANGQLEALMDGMILTVKEGAYNDKYGIEVAGDSSLSLSLF